MKKHFEFWHFQKYSNFSFSSLSQTRFDMSDFFNENSTAILRNLKTLSFLFNKVVDAYKYA
jgi:hypothetical protein